MFCFSLASGASVHGANPALDMHHLCCEDSGGGLLRAQQLNHRCKVDDVNLMEAERRGWWREVGEHSIGTSICLKGKKNGGCNTKTVKCKSIL